MNNGLLLLLFSLLLWTGCETIPGVDGDLRVTPIENPDQSRWQDANFKYKVQEHGGPLTLDDTKDLIQSLLRKGIIVEKAWYQKGSSSCGALQVVVSTQLLLEINKVPEFQAREITDMVEPIESTPNIFCPNNVVEIEPS